jgi:two-component system, LytTR family, sensor kinase
MATGTAPLGDTTHGWWATVRRPIVWVAAFGGGALISLLLFWYRYLDDLVRDRTGSLSTRMIEELTGAIYCVPLVVAVLATGWHFPLDRQHWRRTLPVHVATLIVISVLHTSLNWGVRAALFPLLGMGPYDYGHMPLRYLMEFPNDVIFYALMQIVVASVRYYQTMRDRELSLAQAELRNLRLQIQPHFLFNALNTISATMYDDPVAADAMIEELSELLRLSLRTVHTQEVPLRAELEALSHYTALMRARFGDKLSVAIQVDPAAEDALVPSLILQPLVENAVRHGNASLLGQGHIDVRARRDGDRLTIDVLDDGPGAVVPVKTNGVGLGATADRLRLLYGDAHRFSAGNAQVNGGFGFAVAIAIPFRACAS